MSALKLLAMCQWLRKPFRTIGNIKKKKETEVSLRSTNFVLHMYQQLTSEQRYVISALLKRKVRKNEIAKEIGVSLSTVYREIKRNSSRGGYSPGLAHEMAMERRERIVSNSSVKPDVKREALRLLTTEQWSPKQISGYLAQQGKHISHEKIYQRHVGRTCRPHAPRYEIPALSSLLHVRVGASTLKSNDKNYLADLRLFTKF